MEQTTSETLRQQNVYSVQDDMKILFKATLFFQFQSVVLQLIV